MYSNKIEVSFYLVLLIILSFWGIPFLYICKDFVNHFTETEPKTFFSIKAFLVTVAYIYLFIAPYSIILLITNRLLNLPDYWLSAICYSIITIMTFAVFYIFHNHRYYFDPNIIDVLFFNPISKLGDSISNSDIVNIVLMILYLIPLLGLTLIFHLFPFIFLIILYQGKFHESKYFKLSLSIISFFTLTIIILEKTLGFTKYTLLNGIEIKNDIEYYLIFVVLIFGFLYFKYLAEFISLILFWYFLRDEQINKPTLIKLNIAYILFVLSLNIILANYTNLNFNEIPKSFPGEYLKTEDELEHQDQMNDFREDDYDYR